MFVERLAWNIRSYCKNNFIARNFAKFSIRFRDFGGGIGIDDNAAIFVCFRRHSFPLMIET
jgi:hypothetical protein